MTTDAKSLLSDDLPSDAPEEAVRGYVGVQRLEKLAQQGEERARELGIREGDVPRLVDEVRRERLDCGR